MPPQKHARPCVNAAAALDLLVCDPATLLVPQWGGIAGRKDKSAAKLAREQYEQLLATKVPDDLLDLDTPAASSSAACPFLLSASDAPVTGEALPCLWPGDVVMARYGHNGGFYTARVVRVYSSRGASLVDVEWLRPQAGAPATRIHVCSTGQDETQNCIGLEVGKAVRRASDSQAHAVPPVGIAIPAQRPSAVPAPAPSLPARKETGLSPLLPDLLDLQGPAEASRSAPDLLGSAMDTGIPVAGQLPLAGMQNGAWGNAAPTALMEAPRLPRVSADVVVPGMPLASPVAQPAPMPAQKVTETRQKERFSFVSDMILQAADTAAKVDS